MANFTGGARDTHRMQYLTKQRERQKEDLAKIKQKIQDEASQVARFDGKFAAHYDAIEAQLKSGTVGLVTLDEMRQKQEDYVRKREAQLALKTVGSEPTNSSSKLESLKQAQANQKRVLTFDFDEEDELCNADDDDEDQPATSKGATKEKSSEPEVKSNEPEVKSNEHEPVVKKTKLCKDPTVDTSFLPDREREEMENRLREELRQQWADKQEKVKNENINVAFSYWDGSGHRRDLKMKKGNTIGQFLQRALEVLRPDFHELKTVSADSLMFVKEDLIIAHYHTFYDFIVTKAMGKTGPLFEFDAAGELMRVRGDAALDKQESHPAKVVLRSWYEKNKHIYPASRWEPFVPHKKYDTKKDELELL